jgi:two-component system, chemotaxis family, chemotaxis protein CheY
MISAAQPSRRQALVVDDSRTTRRLIAELLALASLGFEVSTARHGREGLEQLRLLSAPALVLVDWNMPEMDGLSFVRAVRAEPSYAPLLLMMVTTEVEMRKVAQALSVGANEYLMKPFTREMVVEKLAILGMIASPE